MKKGMVFCIFILVLLAGFASAAVNSTNSSSSTLAGAEKAYTCLKNKVFSESCSKLLTFEQKAFSLLALGYDANSQKECRDAVLAEKSSQSCFPKSSCTLKDTSLALLALKNIGADTKSIETWLENQKIKSSGLIWYLEIDADNAVGCTIKYSNNEYSTSINADKKFSSGAGSCLTLASGSYFLKVSENCYDTEFTISCDKDFRTTMLYTKNDSLYVSSRTEAGAGLGNTKEKVNSFCFKQSGSCNYEGTLWASLALSKSGADVSDVLPYLISLQEDNEKYFPEVALYLISNEQGLYNEIINLQKPQKYWQVDNTPYNRYYDSSLALLTAQAEAESARNYFLTIMPDEGCWANSIRDTAFLLWAGWYKKPATLSGSASNLCPTQYNCILESYCSSADKTAYDCSGIGKVCCKSNAPQISCSEKNGKICKSTEECSEQTLIASDTSSCCLGDCQIPTNKDMCEEQGLSYTCRTSCLNNEAKRTAYSCNTGSCCYKVSSSSGSSLWWIWLLVILIILLVLAIIFRNQLKIWLFRIKNNFRKGPAASSLRPSSPGPPSQRPSFSRTLPSFRPMPQQARFMPPQQAKSVKEDKDYEETLKKLRDMSK